MAINTVGLEFQLLQVLPDIDSHNRATSLVKRAIRASDAMFKYEESIVAAVATDLRGAKKVAERLLALARAEEAPTQVRLVIEPFPPALVPAASKVICGQVDVRGRLVPVHDPPSVE